MYYTNVAPPWPLSLPVSNSHATHPSVNVLATELYC